MKDKLNIVLYVNSFLPSLGGREFVVHYLADALTKLGHNARVVGPAGFLKHRKLKFDYPVHRWPTLRGLFPEQRALIQLFIDNAAWGCDVIHAHNTYPTGYYAARLNGVKSYPVVITPHGADIQTIPEIGYGLMLNPDLKKKILYALDKANYITAISKKIRDVLLEAGASSNKVRLIPNGVDIARFSQQGTSNIREWLGIEQDARLIVTIGRYNPRKGQEYLIRAMPGILKTEGRARLVIVGENTEILAPLIKNLGLEGMVVLTGGIKPSNNMLNRAVAHYGEPRDPDYLAELLSASELYVSAGTDDNAEGLSLAVLEAMAAGLPIAATDISGNRDVVLHGENGYLLKPADEESLSDGILRILMHKPLRNQMGKRSKELAMQYDWINIAREYIGVYREAIDIKNTDSSL